MSAAGFRDTPLSYGQRALWFVQRLAPSATAYNVSLPARARDLDTSAFRVAWQALADRHPALRTTYPAPGGSPVGRIHRRLPVDVAEMDASEWTADELERRVVAEADRPFDLERGPVVRLRLFRRAAEVVTLLSLHHIAIDFSSLAILLEELGVAYAAALRGATLELPALTATYEDFVRWQAELLAGERGEALWSTWRSRLAGGPADLALPTDRPRPAQPSFRGATRDLVLGPDSTRGLKALAAAEGVGLDVLVLTAFQALLHRISGQQDILVGSPVPGRGHPGFAEVVGYFINTVVLRGDFSGAPSFRTALVRTQARTEEARAHQDFPFPLLVERLRPARGASPLFQVFFVLYQGKEERIVRLLTGQAGTTLDLGGLRLEPWPLGGRAAMFDLSLLMSDAGDRIAATFQYSSDLFDAATIDRLADDFVALLEAVLADPDQPVAALPASRPQAIPEGPDVDWSQARAETRRALLERQKHLRRSTNRT